MRMYLMAGGGGNRNESGGGRNEMRGGQGGESRNEQRGGQGQGNRNEMAMEYSEMRGGQQGDSNRNEMNMGYSEMRGGQGGNRSEGRYSEMRQGGNRNDMSMEDNMARHRGRDGRYKAGTRRSEYGGEGEMRMGGDEKEYKVKISPEDAYWPMYPYMPRNERGGRSEGGNRSESGNRSGYEEDDLYSDYGSSERRNERKSNYGFDGNTNRQIGFGANMMGEREGKEQEMMRGMGKYESMEFDRETAEKWVKSMKNEDKTHPKGGKWTPEMLKPLAQKFGVPTEGNKFWEFYAMTNAMYSDYCEVVKKFGITSPEFYAQMAKAFIMDKDAVPDKVALYYEMLVEKDE